MLELRSLGKSGPYLTTYRGASTIGPAAQVSAEIPDYRQQRLPRAQLERPSRRGAERGSRRPMLTVICPLPREETQ